MWGVLLAAETDDRIGTDIHQAVNSFSVDSTIIELAKGKLEDPENGSPKYLFQTRVSFDFFTNDKSVQFGRDSIQTLSCSYRWEADTLHVSGGISRLAGGGFHAVVLNRQGIMSHSNCGHTKYRLKNKLSDSASLCIEVDCIASKLVIFNIPDSSKDDFIFGHIEFASKEYFYVNGANADRLRENMKFYFRAYNYRFKSSRR